MYVSKLVGYIDKNIPVFDDGRCFYYKSSYGCFPIDKEDLIALGDRFVAKVKNNKNFK